MSTLPFPTSQVPEFCRRWRIRQFSLIGSALRPDFTADSDIDVVVIFEPNAAWSLFDVVLMRDELTSIFGHPVDIIEETAVRNPFMIDSIRRTKRVLHAA